MDPDDPYGARSPADAQWLKRHGYPDKYMLREYGGMPDEKLSSLAETGDLYAAAILAQLQGMRNGGKQPLLDLNELTIKGSIFALTAIANLYANSAHYRNPVVAEAYYRAAIMRGDQSSAFRLNRPTLDFEQQVAADLFAMNIYENLIRERIRRHGSPFPFDPRPGTAEMAGQLLKSLEERKRLPTTESNK